jgi:hypothetical protein
VVSKFFDTHNFVFSNTLYRIPTKTKYRVFYVTRSAILAPVTQHIFYYTKALILEDNLLRDEYFLTRALGEDPYDMVYRTDLYEAGKDKQELRFDSDGIVHGPNSGWTWSTDNKVSVFYFEEDKHIFREWGYVVWD